VKGVVDEDTAQAVRDFTYWKTSFIQDTDLVVPPNYDTYGRTLAILECAIRDNPDTTTAFMIHQTSTALFKDLADWTQDQSTAHVSREQQLRAKHRKRRLMNRMAMSTFSGLRLILPMLIMVMDPRRVTTLVVTSVFTLGIGLILAVWMTDAENVTNLFLFHWPGARDLLPVISKILFPFLKRRAIAN
jgi:hypothetical protein